MDHPKEAKINQWISEQKQPISMKDIFSHFVSDLESCVMAATLVGIDLGMDLKDYCRGIPLEDRIDRYSPYPLWFKTFIRQDIDHAVKIFKLNGDKDGYAKDIVDDWKDEDEFVNLVKNAQAFDNNQFKVTFKEVLLSNESNFDKNISQEFEERINTGDKLDFEEEMDKKLFYFLHLNHHADFAMDDLNQFNAFADKYAEKFFTRDVFALGKIADSYIYFSSTEQIFIYFDEEPKIAFDKRGLSKAVLKELGEKAEDLGEEALDEFIKESLGELVAGRAYTVGKILFKLAKKGYEIKQENIDVTFDEDDAEEFYDRFAKAYSKGKTIREFFMEEVKIPMQKFYIKKRLDFNDLDDSFFDKQYKHFMQTRFYSKMGSLSEDLQKKIDQEQNQDKKDTLIFIAVSKKHEKSVTVAHDLGY